MSSSFRSAKKDDDDVESLVGTTKYAGGAGLQKWDKAVLVDLGTGEQPWLKEVYMGELQTPTTDEEAKVTAKKIWKQRPLHEMMKRLAMPKGFKKLATQEAVTARGKAKVFRALVKRTEPQSTAQGTACALAFAVFCTHLH